MRWPKDRPFPVTIRPRRLVRRYGPLREVWVVRWYYPANSVHVRSFPTEAAAEEWVTRIRADPELGTGERLQRELRAAQERRLAEHYAAKELLLEMAPAAPARGIYRRRSPYRPEPVEPARLGGTIRERRRSRGGVSYAIDYYDGRGKRHTKTLPTRREAVAWRDETLMRLALAKAQPAEAPAAQPERASPRALDNSPRIGWELAEIKRLLKGQRSEHEAAPAILRRLTEIERHIRLTEVPVAPKPTRRHPVG